MEGSPASRIVSKVLTAYHAGADSRHAVKAKHDKHAAEHHAAHPANAAAAAWLAVANVLLVIRARVEG